MAILWPGAALTAALLLMAGCTSTPAPPQTVAQPVIEVVEAPEWMRLASVDDQDRIARLGQAWSEALAEARAKGFTRAITQEGELLQPGAALAAPSPPPGSYRCRVIKLGTQGARETAFASHKSFFCYVEAEGNRLNITKQTGSQRPAGWIYPDVDESRLIFLGTLALGDEKEPIPYGENSERDLAGVVERVAPYRYRLVVPWPRLESKLDVIELVPAPQ
jgi:hypothetical protein